MLAGVYVDDLTAATVDCTVCPLCGEVAVKNDRANVYWHSESVWEDGGEWYQPSALLRKTHPTNKLRESVVCETHKNGPCCTVRSNRKNGCVGCSAGHMLGKGLERRFVDPVKVDVWAAD
jgi:hypothetical protein